MLEEANHPVLEVGLHEPEPPLVPIHSLPVHGQSEVYLLSLLKDPNPLWTCYQHETVNRGGAVHRKAVVTCDVMLDLDVSWHVHEGLDQLDLLLVLPVLVGTKAELLQESCCDLPQVGFRLPWFRGTL